MSSLRTFLISALIAFSIQPATAGQMSGLMAWDRISIHSGLLPDGRIITFGTNDEDLQYGFDNVIWNPKLGFGPASRLLKPNSYSFDSFCTASVINPATLGLLMAGGNTDYEASEFFANGEQMSSFASMAYPRWYATATTLPSGQIMLNGGTPTPEVTQLVATEFTEVYTPGEGWRVLFNTNNSPMRRGGADATGNPFWYPRVYPINENEVFLLAGKYSFIMDHRGDGTIRDEKEHGLPNWGASATTVMVRPGKLMQIGGGSWNSDSTKGADGSKQATIIDLTQSGFPQTNSYMKYGRNWADATLLANGEVFVAGGGLSNNTNVGIRYQTEIYNPDTNSWRTDASLNRPRLYHSSAVLMKDGRVFLGGGGIPGPTIERNAEIYTPDYLLNADGSPATRPSIQNAPARITHGASFTIETDKPISRMTLLKTGVATHSFNSDQRFFELSYTGSNGTYQTSFPNDPINATPGLYMIYVFDDKGIASEGKFVRLPGDVDDGTSPPDDLPTATAALWTFCADEDATCTVPKKATVRYGVNGQYTQATVTGSISCSNNSFGDPAPSAKKTCDYQVLPEETSGVLELTGGVSDYVIYVDDANDYTIVRIATGEVFSLEGITTVNAVDLGQSFSIAEVQAVAVPAPKPTLLELPGVVADYRVLVDPQGIYTVERIVTGEIISLDGILNVSLVDINQTYDIETVRSVAVPTN